MLVTSRTCDIVLVTRKEHRDTVLITRGEYIDTVIVTSRPCEPIEPSSKVHNTQVFSNSVITTTKYQYLHFTHQKSIKTLS